MTSPHRLGNVPLISKTQHPLCLCLSYRKHNNLKPSWETKPHWSRAISVGNNTFFALTRPHLIWLVNFAEKEKQKTVSEAGWCPPCLSPSVFLLPPGHLLCWVLSGAEAAGGNRILHSEVPVTSVASRRLTEGKLPACPTGKHSCDFSHLKWTIQLSVSSHLSATFCFFFIIQKIHCSNTGLFHAFFPLHIQQTVTEFTHCTLFPKINKWCSRTLSTLTLI